MRPLFAALALFPGILFSNPAQAQTDLPTLEASSPRVEMDADGSLLLSAGRVTEVIEQFEKCLPELKKVHGNDDWTIPNIVFHPDVRDAFVAAPLRLRNVTPIQALTLIASAAGCSLEKIYSPGQESESAIIGYRVVAAPAFAAGRHDGPASLMLQEESTGSPVAAGRPTPSLQPLPGARGGGGGHREHESNTVRVYAVGPVLRGEPKEVEEKYRAMFELIVKVFEMPEKSPKIPEISFHHDTRTLIVNATPMQHDIIQQILTALRENEASNIDVQKR